MLNELPDADVAVYAVWFEMVASDSEERWSGELLHDPRVSHHWDAAKVVGTWYGENVTAQEEGHVEWDAWFLYGPDAAWGPEGPSDQRGWGRTIAATREELKERLLESLGDGRP